MAVYRLEADNRPVSGKISSSFRPEADCGAGGCLPAASVRFFPAARYAYSVVEQVAGIVVELPQGICPDGVFSRFQIVGELDASGESVSAALTFTLTTASPLLSRISAYMKLLGGRADRRDASIVHPLNQMVSPAVKQLRS